MTETGPGAASGSCPLKWSGSSASCSVSFETNIVGTYAITGTYKGDAVHTGSTAMTTVLVSIT
jgi:hypothetical protein